MVYFPIKPMIFLYLRHRYTEIITFFVFVSPFALKSYHDIIKADRNKNKTPSFFSPEMKGKS
jgi:hypothetical protein